MITQMPKKLGALIIVLLLDSVVLLVMIYLSHPAVPAAHCSGSAPVIAPLPARGWV